MANSIELSKTYYIITYLLQDLFIWVATALISSGPRLRAGIGPLPLVTAFLIFCSTIPSQKSGPQQPRGLGLKAQPSGHYLTLPALARGAVIHKDLLALWCLADPWRAQDPYAQKQSRPGPEHQFPRKKPPFWKSRTIHIKKLLYIYNK
jgi:hypothetical protein